MDLQVASSGLRVPKAIAPPKKAKSAARKFGIDLDGHLSKPITLEMGQSYNLFIVMEGWQVSIF